jgi:hypothetical protein
MLSIINRGAGEGESAAKKSADVDPAAERDFRRSVERTRRCLVRELADGGGDPAPDCCAIVVILRSELIGAPGAFLEGLLAVPLEHQGGGAPDVDLRYHRHRLTRRGLSVV